MDQELVEWLHEHGCAPTGEVVARIRPWSSSWRVPTTEGIVWLKVNGPGCRHEAQLYRTFVETGCPHVLAPIALDVARGWLLLPDAGPTLMTVLDRAPDPAHWERVLPKYAELQRHLEARALPGVPDLRPGRLPALFADLLARLPVQHRTDLEALLPRFTDWCDELAASGIAATVQHDDLHENNISTNDVLFDWADAALAFPFSSLLVTLRSARDRWPDLDLVRLRDAYLEAWTDSHSRTELELLCLLATRVGKVGRAAAWERALTAVPDPGGHLEAAPGWLEELLEEDVF